MILLVFVGIATFVRLYVFEPVKLMDTSMAPRFKENSITWMCKVPQCFIGLNDEDVVWVKLKSGETQVRNLLAMPGDSLEITDKGQVTTSHKNYSWEGEDAFIQSRKIYVPKAGDTLVFNELSDVEQDYIISYLRDKGESVLVKTTLWQGNREINIDRVGSTKIANRQVSLNEIDFLPWQDRYLIEEQIRHSEPGNAPIKLKRQLFHGKMQVPVAEHDSTTQDSSAVDSAKVATDSTKVATADSTVTVVADSTSKVAEAPKNKPQAVKVFGEEITKIVVNDDCYYLVCNKSSACPDSREMGYYTEDRMIGRHVQWPDRIKETFIEPVITYVHFAETLVVDSWTRAVKFVEQKFQSVKEFFQKKEEPSESAPDASNAPPKKNHRQVIKPAKMDSQE